MHDIPVCVIYFAENSFLGLEGVSTKVPKLDVFNSATDQNIFLVRIKLHIENLRKKTKLQIGEHKSFSKHFEAYSVSMSPSCCKNFAFSPVPDVNG